MHGFVNVYESEQRLFDPYHDDLNGDMYGGAVSAVRLDRARPASVSLPSTVRYVRQRMEEHPEPTFIDMTANLSDSEVQMQSFEDASNHVVQTGFARSQMSKLNAFAATDDYDCGSAECIICNDSFVFGESLCTLPCNHTFHYVCILFWANRSKKCPICRAIMIPPESNEATVPQCGM
jgi:hypothetical protein